MVIAQRKEYNILVLGQTGAGKSTFINGLYNYFSFENFYEALRASQIKYCIPTIFDWYGEHKIVIGQNEDEGEHQKIGQSATQNVRSYLFEFGNTAVRIIDTPGFGDTEGREKDEQICEKLLNFLTTRDELLVLHGIIFVFSSLINRKTTFFTYCIEQIFSKLHRDASDNIIFVFTHTKASNYKPGSTSILIKDLLKHIKHVNIKCKKENMFCLENDCIKFLLAYFYNTVDLTFSKDEMEKCQTAWKKSSDECIRLINYIKTLTPHPVKDTVLINSVRDYTVKLRNHLPSILTTIKIHIKNCEEVERKIRECGDNLEALKAQLYKRTYIKREGKKHLVCRNPKCSKRESHGKNKIACCPNCIAISKMCCKQIKLISSNCRVCGCCDLDHVFEDNNNYADIEEELDTNVEFTIKEKREIKRKEKLTLFNLIIIIKKYKAESKYIEDCIKRLSEYLKKTSVLSDQTRFGGTDNSMTSEESISIELIEKTLTSLDMSGKDIQELFKREDIAGPTEKPYYFDKIPANWQETLANN